MPWKHVYQTAKVIENYAAGDDNVLAISRGQHIIIVNKDGDARGWWKGRFNDRVPINYTFFWYARYSIIFFIIFQEGYFPKTYVVEDSFYQGR